MPGSGKFEIAGKERGLISGSKKQNDGVVVLRGLSDSPAVRRMQHGELAQPLAGNDKAQRHAASLGQFEKGAIGGNHRVASQPQFSHFEVRQDIEQSGQVVVVRVCQTQRCPAVEFPARTGKR